MKDKLISCDLPGNLRKITERLDDEIVQALIRMVQVNPNSTITRLKALRSSGSGPMLDLKSSKGILDEIGDPYSARSLYWVGSGIEGAPSSQFQITASVPAIGAEDKAKELMEAQNDVAFWKNETTMAREYNAGQDTRFRLFRENMKAMLAISVECLEPEDKIKFEMIQLLLEKY